jgi:hypothetical protein
MTRAARRLALAVFTAVVAVTTVVAVLPASAEGELAVVELKPGDVVKRTFQSANVNDGGNFIAPADCRDDAPTCDVIRVRLDRDRSEDALNFLRVELTWDGGAQAPSLVLVVAGLGAGPVNDLDMYVYDEEGAKVEGTGGASAGTLEVAGIVAEKDVYDLVVNQFTGATTEYTMEFIFSNELFESPLESLDPSLRDASGSGPAPVDRSGAAFSPAASAPAASVSFVDVPGGGADSVGLEPSVGAAALVPVDADADFSGFRGAVDDALEGAPLRAVSSASVRTAEAEPPATAVVVFWLLLAPLALLVGVVLFLRRLRPAALSA